MIPLHWAERPYPNCFQINEQFITSEGQRYPSGAKFYTLDEHKENPGPGLYIRKTENECRIELVELTSGVMPGQDQDTVMQYLAVELVKFNPGPRNRKAPRWQIATKN